MDRRTEAPDSGRGVRDEEETKQKPRDQESTPTVGVSEEKAGVVKCLGTRE